MKTYLISYDLHNPARDCQSQHDAIRGIADGCWHQVMGVWFINASSDAGEIRDHLRNHLDQRDEVLVISLGRNWATFNMSNPGNDWLRSYLRPDRFAA